MQDSIKYSVATRYQDCVFDPEATHAMGIAFDRMCKLFALMDSDHEMRNFVAVTIVNVASQGECDPEKICAMAIRSLAVVSDSVFFTSDRKREVRHAQKAGCSDATLEQSVYDSIPSEPRESWSEAV